MWSAGRLAASSLNKNALISILKLRPLSLKPPTSRLLLELWSTRSDPATKSPSL